MKTHDELFTQFRREFDKDRKKSLIALVYEVPFMVLIVILLSLMLIFIIKAHFRGDFIEDGLGMQIVMIFMSIFLFVLLLAAVMGPPYVFLSFYDTNGLRKSTQSKIDSLLIEKSKVIEKLDPAKERFIDTLAFSNWMCSPEIAILVTHHNWQNYVNETHTNSQQIVDKYQKETDSINTEIKENEVLSELYFLVPEKNFWQYMKSMKWIKKIK